MNDPVLRTHGLRIAYRMHEGSFDALHDIDVELGAGEILGVVGESGCGKSTLASALMRLLPPNGAVTKGSVYFEGQDLLRLSDQEMRRIRGARIGMVFQDPLSSLNPTFRVSTQMVDVQRAHAGPARPDSETLRERAIQMLERVGLSDARHRIDDYPHQFSGGMCQRIMIATVLLLRPRILICDEATSALDVTLQAQVLKLLGELCREQGTSLLLITHDIGVVGQMCDRVYVMYAGRVVEAGSVTDVLTSPGHPYTRKLVASVPSRHRRDERLSTIRGHVPSLAALPQGCTFAPRCDAAQPVCEQAEPELIEVEGHLFRCLPHIRDAATGAPPARTDDREPERADRRPRNGRPSSNLVEVRGLRAYFTERRDIIDRITRRPVRTVRAVDGIDLSLGHGEIVGLVGESGSGKTTLGKALLNLAPQTNGTVTFDGVALSELDAAGWRRMRHRIRMIFQETYGSLSPRLRVRQLVTEPYVIARTAQQDRRTAEELLALVGLSAEQASKHPHQLSGGQARRVQVARALAIQPDFIVADEPTAGLDVSAAAGVLNLLLELRDRLSLTLLIITHDLNLVGYVADRITVMRAGKIVETGPVDQIMERPAHPYTQLLLQSIPDPWAHRDTATP